MAAGGLAAQAPAPTAARDGRALDVLTRALAQMGATQAALLTDSITVAQTGRPGAPVKTSTITTLGANRMRADSVAAGVTTSSVLDRGREMVLGPKGWTARAPANAVNQRLLHLPGPMLAWELARSNTGVGWVGNETAADTGQARTHLTLTRVSALGGAGGAQATAASALEIFIDPDALTVMRIGWRQQSDKDVRTSAAMAIDYSDYRAVATPIGSVLLPFHTRTTFEGQVVSEANITSYQFNTGVPPSLFAVAAGGGQ